MCDMSGVVSSAPQDPSTFAPNTMAGPTDTSSFAASQPSFGAAPSTIAASAPMGGAGGGGAVSAPGPGAPSASPAGFDLSSQGAAAFGSTNPAALETAQNVLNAPDPNAPGATAGGAATANVAGAAPRTNSVMDAIRNPGTDSILNAVSSNLGPLASLGILGFEAANKPGGVGSTSQQLPAQAQPGPTAGALVNEAKNLQTSGQTLSQPLMTGVLPPGAQAQIDQMTKAEEARIRSQFASMGLSGSTMEAGAIETSREQAQSRGFDIALNMARLGLSDIGASSSIFQQLLQSGLQSDQEFQQALTQFASSLAGGSAKAA